MTELPDVIYALNITSRMLVNGEYVATHAMWNDSRDNNSNVVKYLRADRLPHLELDIDAIHAKPKGDERTAALESLLKIDNGNEPTGYDIDTIRAALSQPLPSEHKPDVVAQLVEALRHAHCRLGAIMDSCGGTEEYARDKGFHGFWTNASKPMNEIEQALALAEQDKQ